jgi:uncharacterized protein YutE (UPF0331/DUF86 family)
MNFAHAVFQIFNGFIMKTIEGKIKAAEERVQRLVTISKRLQSYEQFQSDLDLKDITERNLQIAIETCLDIAKIIILQKKLPEPKDNKGMFTILAENDIIDHQSLSFMIPMAGTRNILVHGYDKIDDSLIFGILKKHLGGFHVFLRQIRDSFL